MLQPPKLSSPGSCRKIGVKNGKVMCVFVASHGLVLLGLSGFTVLLWIVDFSFCSAAVVLGRYLIVR